MSGNGRVAADKEVSAQVFQLVASKIENSVAGENGRVMVSEKIGGTDDETGAAVPAGPRHSIELDLYLAQRQERIVEVQGAQVVEGCCGAKDGASHVSQTPDSRVEVGAAD
eukprot:6194404-Pleurochrysis_carterae.AAC.2